MNSIRDWLNSSRDYNMGAALYKVYGDDDDLKDVFAQGPSEYRKQRLLDAMKKLKDNAPEHIPIAPAPKKTARQEVLPENKVQPNEDPYREEWMPLYQRMNFLRHQLHEVKTVQERGMMAHEILDLEQDCKRWWYKRDYYLKYGMNLPEEEKKSEEITDRNELFRNLTNYRTYLSKAEAALKINPGDARAKKKKEKYAPLIRQLETRLGKTKPTDEETDSEPA